MSRQDYGASLRKYLELITGLRINYGSSSFSLETIQPPSGIKGGRILLLEAVAKWFMVPKTLSKLYKETLSEEVRRNGWVLWRIGNCARPSIDFDYIIDTFKLKDKGVDWESPVYAECYPNKPLENLKLSPLSKAWQKYIGKPFIPFDLEERKKIIASSPKLAEKAAVWKQRKKTEEES
jgi:hypothetical protein